MKKEKGWPNFVLLRIQFTNYALIPIGIPIIEKSFADIGTLVEKNEVDGVYSSAEQVSVWESVRELYKNGYRVTDVHCFLKRTSGGKKYMLVISFGMGYPFSLLDFALDSLDQLLRKDAWSHCHLWRNPNDSWTVNLVHRLPDKALSDDIGDMFIFGSVQEQGAEVLNFAKP